MRERIRKDGIGNWPVKVIFISMNYAGKHGRIKVLPREWYDGNMGNNHVYILLVR